MAKRPAPPKPKPLPRENESLMNYEFYLGSVIILSITILVIIGIILSL